MLFAHFLITAYQRGEAHPIWGALVHWLACFALTVAMWIGLVLVLLLLAAVLGQ